MADHKPRQLGSDSPAARFASMPRGDRAQPRFVRCLNPFRWLEVGDGGEVTPCCSPWFKGSLGNIKHQSMQEIWNGEKYRAVREAMYPGGDWGKFCNAQTCPMIQNDTWVPVDFITPETPDSAPITPSMLEDVRDGRIDMREGPAQIGLSCDPRCNLRCIMCSTLTNPNRDGVALREAIQGLKSFLPTVKRIKMMGDGEVFAVPESREFLFNFDSAAHPEAAFLIHTNGVLLTPALWERIEHIRIDWMTVSIDGARKETFERIRRGGRWEVLMENLDFLVEKYRQGTIRELHLNMTVMKSNHHELVEFAEMGRRLGVTGVYYQPVLGDYGEEQMFDRRDLPALRRLSRQLQSPELNRPDVDTSALVRWRHWRPDLRDYLRHAKRSMRRMLQPAA